MCIVIDTNTLASVFNQNCKKHPEFEPVNKWILEGEGHVVYGGKKYKKELLKANRYRRLFIQLKAARRAFEIDENMVDTEHTRLEEVTKGTDCDDQHIIAIFIVSRCRLFCSDDRKADKFIKKKSLYPRRHPRPKIYRSRNQESLLCRSYIVQLHNVK